MAIRCLLCAKNRVIDTMCSLSHVNFRAICEIGGSMLTWEQHFNWYCLEVFKLQLMRWVRLYLENFPWGLQSQPVSGNSLWWLRGLETDLPGVDFKCETLTNHATSSKLFNLSVKWGWWERPGNNHHLKGYQRTHLTDSYKALRMGWGTWMAQ